MDVDRCVCCGEYVPEGRMVCFDCEKIVYGESEDGRTLTLMSVRQKEGKSRYAEMRDKKY